MSDTAYEAAVRLQAALVDIRADLAKLRGDMEAYEQHSQRARAMLASLGNAEETSDDLRRARDVLNAARERQGG